MGRQFFRDSIIDKQQVPENQMPITQAPEDPKNSGNSHAKAVLEQSNGPKTGDKFLPPLILGEDQKFELKLPESQARLDKTVKIDQSLLRHEPYSFGQATVSIGAPVVRGAFNEITEHYGRVAMSGVMGFGIGYGLQYLSPSMTKYVAIAGLALTGYQLIKSVPTWYNSAKVLADSGSDREEFRKAERVMEGFGAGSVNVTAGIIGGAYGARVGIEMQKPVRFNDAGLPTKMPLPDEKGSAYVRYDANGKVVELVQQYKSSNINPEGFSRPAWRQITRSYARPYDNYQYFSQGTDGFAKIDPYNDLVKFIPDKTGLTIVEETGITQLRAQGASTITRTTEQAAKAQVLNAWFDKTHGQIASGETTFGAALNRFFFRILP